MHGQFVHLVKISTRMKTVTATLILVLVLSFSYFYKNSNTRFDAYNYPLQTTNKIFTLNEIKEQKKVALLYFGFLSCPEACPTTLSTMASAINELSVEELEKIEFIFIDLDPERDSLKDIGDYAKYFNEKITPVSVPLKDLDNFTKKFGIVFMKLNIQSEMDYTIEHSVDVVVLDQQGKMREPIHSGSPKVVYLQRIRELIKNKEL